MGMVTETVSVLTFCDQYNDGYSDPVVPNGRAIAQRIKGTSG